ncbi:MAG TPA: hypothetical protein VM533_19795 [Fimbriiglobus sp.]|jgi:hypothetical protein|nr:hypothetical protein [Fimbriiglobus sp.]
MTRPLIRLLRVAALVGMSLSITGLVLLLVQSVRLAANNPWVGVPEPIPGPLLYVFHALREAGVPLVLCGILFVVCEIALRDDPATTVRDEV